MKYLIIDAGTQNSSIERTTTTTTTGRNVAEAIQSIITITMVVIIIIISPSPANLDRCRCWVMSWKSGPQMRCF